MGKAASGIIDNTINDDVVMKRRGNTTFFCILDFAGKIVWPPAAVNVLAVREWHAREKFQKSLSDTKMFQRSVCRS